MAVFLPETPTVAAWPGGAEGAESNRCILRRPMAVLDHSTCENASFMLLH